MHIWCSASVIVPPFQRSQIGQLGKDFTLRESQLVLGSSGPKRKLGFIANERVMACHRASESQTGPGVQRASGQAGSPTAQAALPGDGSSRDGSLSCRDRGTSTSLTPTLQPLEPMPFVISSLLHSPCYDPAFSVAICWIVASRETQATAHTPVELLLQSVRGQDLVGGRKQFLRRACF